MGPGGVRPSRPEHQLSTPDLIEDLALLGALEGKGVVGSINRGGLKSARFEMDDRFTAYTVGSIVGSNLDFGKLLLRINFDDIGSIHTLEAAAEAISAAAVARVRGGSADSLQDHRFRCREPPADA
jgi:hypothetical protein